jgi:hypothetical protein
MAWSDQNHSDDQVYSGMPGKKKRALRPAAMLLTWGGDLRQQA